MLDQIYKILGVTNRVLWLIIGLVVLYAIFKVGTVGVEQTIGGNVSGNVSGGQTQPQPNGQTPNPGGQNQNPAPQGQTQPK